MYDILHQPVHENTRYKQVHDTHDTGYKQVHDTHDTVNRNSIQLAADIEAASAGAGNQ